MSVVIIATHKGKRALLRFGPLGLTLFDKLVPMDDIRYIDWPKPGTLILKLRTDAGEIEDLHFTSVWIRGTAESFAGAMP